MMPIVRASVRVPNSRTAPREKEGTPASHSVQEPPGQGHRLRYQFREKGKAMIEAGPCCLLTLERAAPHVPVQAKHRIFHESFKSL